MPATKVRLRFAKSGEFRLVSHLDLMRCLDRALRRADLDVAKTQGFNARAKVAFSLPLALGIEGRAEVVDIEFKTPVEPDDVRNRLSAVLPPSFSILDAAVLPAGSAASPTAAHYSIWLPTDRQTAAANGIEAFLEARSWAIERVRPGRTSRFDLRPSVLAATLSNDRCLSFTLRIEPSGSARPEEFLDALGLHDVLQTGCVLIRDGIAFEGSHEYPIPVKIRNQAASVDHGDDTRTDQIDNKPEFTR